VTEAHLCEQLAQGCYLKARHVVRHVLANSRGDIPAVTPA